jgi:hypothetical protein
MEEKTTGWIEPDMKVCGGSLWEFLSQKKKKKKKERDNNN